MAAQMLEIDMNAYDTQVPQVTVVVADDNRIFLRGLKRVLEEAGCNVIACLDGDEALDVLQHHNADVVVLDYRMPRMRGTEVAQAIRSFGGRFKYIPIIGISVDDDDQLGERCLESGMNAFLTKLSPPEVIEEAVLGWAKRWRQHECPDSGSTDNSQTG